MTKRVTSPFFIGIGIFTLIFLFQFRSLIAHLSEPLSLSHGDSYLVMFILRSTMDSILSGNWTQISTLPMFYGNAHSLFFTEHHLLQSIISIPLYLISSNIFVTYYTLALFSLWISGVVVYAFLWKRIQLMVPALFGAIVFSLNPFIMARFPDHMLLSTGVFLILMLYSFEEVIRTGSKKQTFLMFLWASLQLVASSTHYSVFLSVIAPLYIVIRLVQEKQIAKFKNSATGWGILLFLLVLTIQWRAYAPVYAQSQGGRSIEESVTFSDNPSDWLFTAPNSLIYGTLKEKASEAMPSVVRVGVESEQNMFPGSIVMLLFVLSFWLVRSGVWIPSMVVTLCSFILSLGPNGIFYTLIYRINPLFSLVRVPARFGMFVFLGLSLVASFVLAELIRKKYKQGMVIAILCTLLLLIEYSVKPYDFLTITPETKEFYQHVRASDSRVILDLPVMNALPPGAPEFRIEDADARYLLWALYHTKTLYNGYSGVIPQSFRKLAAQFAIRFPTLSSIKRLESEGVDGIILHRDEWANPQEFDRIRGALLEMGYKEYAHTPELSYIRLQRFE